MHPSQRLLHVTPISQPLYVIAAVENPEQYAARYRHYHTFAKHVEDAGGILYTVEVVMGNRNFEVTTSHNPRHIQLRAKTELWRKENLQNIAVSHLPQDWQHVAMWDADFISARPDWVQATIQSLQRYDAVQLFSTYSCLKSDYTIDSTNDGFVYAWRKAGTKPAKYGARGATGGGWAYRRSAWDLTGGLLQTPILGSADWYMTFALAGQPDQNKNEELSRCAPAYVKSVDDWCARAKAVNRNIGFVQNHGLHYWHGPIANRGYGWRWKILATHAFDPATDLVVEPSGLLELSGNKPGLRDDIRDYMASRQEDQI